MVLVGRGRVVSDGSITGGRTPRMELGSAWDMAFSTEEVWMDLMICL